MLSHTPQVSFGTPKLKKPLIYLLNELADIIGKSIVQSSILKEVHEAKYFSIMVDGIASF